MNVLSFPKLKGRVLVVGPRALSAPLVERLSASGYHCAAAEGANTLLKVAASLNPEAILFATDGDDGSLKMIRDDDRLRDLPRVADLSAGDPSTLRKLEVDEWVRTPDELPDRLEGAMRARRLIERDAHSRRRLEALLEITQAATSSLELDQILQISLDKVGQVIDDRPLPRWCWSRAPRTGSRRWSPRGRSPTSRRSRSTSRATPSCAGCSRPASRCSSRTRSRDPLMDEVPRLTRSRSG